MLFHWFVNSPGPFSPIPVCTPGWREAVGEWKLLPNKDIFNWVSKVFQDCCDFASPHSVIGPENSRHSLNQSDAKLKPNTTCSPAFSRAIGYLVGFEVFIGPYRYFPFIGLAVVITLVLFLWHSIEKRSNTTKWPGQGSKTELLSLLTMRPCVSPVKEKSIKIMQI